MFKNAIVSALTLGLLFIVGLSQSSAQNANPLNSLLYSNQANMFSSQGSAMDPVSIVMPGTAYAGGFGSFLDNPASAALVNQSYGQFGLAYTNVEESVQFANSSPLLDDSQFNLSNAGFIYSFPTSQGSLVVGAGYNQHTVFNRALRFSGRNEQTTITDQFKTPGSTYADIAFNTFAIDYGDEFQDWDESIFRIGFDDFGDYLGVQQQGEIFESGYGGEYSFFAATEFQENLMIGVSLGVLNGQYKYDRLFQEVDNFNIYSSDFIDSNDDGTGDTDIDNILLQDQIRSTYTGIKLRAGLIYKLAEVFNIGASYTLGTRMQIEEKFDANIQTTFDNSVTFEDELNSEFTYYVEMPSRASIGFALNDVNSISISASAEYVDYAGTRIDFNDGSLFEDEIAENEFIESNFRPVWNLRGGVEFKVNEGFILRGGYGFLPSKFENGTDDRSIFSFGTGISVNDNIQLELAMQYKYWDEVSSVYDYADYDYSTLPDEPPTFTTRSENASRSVDRLMLLSTLRFNLY
ncbi:outer membrane protein transport protein [Rhodohalobacter sp.]|uniref:outer membrane protein transport protein n=1 Tax=Rhodohalobacter sp. TaxID=1974210 RepID=UPI002ACE8727|nr:outer membrane protein transport protein [Rhodohalobacter sp.]MDZ7758012.1 outer membrane protein transport protein [Rhodohalobacter sp.]